MKKIFLTLLVGCLLVPQLSHAKGNFALKPYLDVLAKNIQKGDKQSKEFSELKTRWEKESPIPLARLTCVQFSYINFDGQEKQDGELVVMDAVAPQVLAILQELFNKKFPLHQAKRIEFFEADDDKSLEANNSACYNCRTIIGDSKNHSMHAYGVAIDINPIQNPFHGFESDDNQEKGIRHTKPASGGTNYINRHRAQKDKLPCLSEYVVDVFYKNGFTTWGGNWNFPIDWQHFQPSRSMAQLLTVMSPQDATKFFALHVASLKSAPSNLMTNFPTKDTALIDLYQENPQKFMELFEAHKEWFEVADSDTALKAVKLMWSS
ncbi:MAG: M15 family metallopeptidase [Simkaniaceae bacterium]|nr:M15 family metallopeptidase [Simkaniaceae bacterium]